MFRKVLIANRGEIAIRIAKTLQMMGIRVVAIYSPEDHDVFHLRFADEAYPLIGTSPKETYLSISQIIEIAKVAHVDAIHPGYGFLSENPLFAEACEQPGLTFIGPSPKVMRLLGDKLMAKKTASQLGIPVIPGGEMPGRLDRNEILQLANSIGYPVLIKATAGGGGKGMRLVHESKDLLPAVEAARREAKAAFGDDRIFVEKYISEPRHIEIQILGDHHGNLVHLFDRECSIQRRYQKIVEESPSVALTASLRNRMGEAAVTAAKAVGYTNAGTVEFILDKKGEFYFLEVNTRLQVEHPVTEMIAHRDLVEAQILVAANEKLPFIQKQLRMDGHAIECRIYAEDTTRGFVPCTGIIERYIPPDGPNIRVDSGVAEGTFIGVDYDPMIAKLITWGESRRRAIQKMVWALQHFVILGITTNLDFLQQLFNHPEFVAGNLHTQFIKEHHDALTQQFIPDEAILVAAFTASQHGKHESSQTLTPTQGIKSGGPWDTLFGWRAF